MGNQQSYLPRIRLGLACKSDNDIFLTLDDMVIGFGAMETGFNDELLATRKVCKLIRVNITYSDETCVIAILYYVKLISMYLDGE